MDQLSEFIFTVLIAGMKEPGHPFDTFAIFKFEKFNGPIVEKNMKTLRMISGTIDEQRQFAAAAFFPAAEIEITAAVEVQQFRTRDSLVAGSGTNQELERSLISGKEFFDSFLRFLYQDDNFVIYY